MRKLLIIGAGFDAPAGIPTMAGFFHKAWEFMGREFMGDHVGFESFPDDLPRFVRVRELWQTWRKEPDTGSPTDLEKFAMFVEQSRVGYMPDLRYVIVRTFELARRSWVLPHEACGGHLSTGAYR